MENEIVESDSVHDNRSLYQQTVSILRPKNGTFTVYASYTKQQKQLIQKERKRTKLKINGLDYSNYRGNFISWLVKWKLTVTAKQNDLLRSDFFNNARKR